MVKAKAAVKKTAKKAGKTVRVVKSAKAAKAAPGMDRIVRFAYEIGSARSRPRGWQQSLNENMANVAEHCYRVTFLAMLLAVMEKGDPYRAAAIAMVHDTDEIRGLDLTPYQKPYVSVDSEKAVRDTFEGTALANVCLPLFEEYKKKASIEAKCVKDADILDATLELLEITHRGSTYIHNIPEQQEMRRAGLRTKSGKMLYDAIVTSKATPWDWFLKGPSTFRAGTYGK